MRPKIAIKYFEKRDLEIFRTTLYIVKFQCHLVTLGTFACNSFNNDAGSNGVYIAVSFWCWNFLKQPKGQSCVILFSGKSHIFCLATPRKTVCNFMHQRKEKNAGQY